VFVTGTAWPDLIVAALMAGLFLWSSLQIVRQALAERRRGEAQAAATRVPVIGGVSPVRDRAPRD
jgi:Co/Zn/Cd efflux system component